MKVATVLHIIIKPDLIRERGPHHPQFDIPAFKVTPFDDSKKMCHWFILSEKIKK